MATWEILPSRVPNLCPQQNRLPGLHLTDVLQRLLNLNKGLEGVKPYEHTLHGESGKEFEHIYRLRLQQHFPGRYIEPKPLMANIGKPDDPIPLHLTPDLLDVHENRVIDLKWTTKSSLNWNPTEESAATWYIRSQLMCYCRTMGTLKGGFIIRYDRGNYRDTQIDQLECNVEFSQVELDSIWSEVVVMGRLMAKELSNE